MASPFFCFGEMFGVKCMEFLNVGFGELLALALIGLILFGPEDLLRIARTLGGYIRSAQQMWREVASHLEVDLTDIDPVDLRPQRGTTPPSASSVSPTQAGDKPTTEVALPASPQIGGAPETAQAAASVDESDVEAEDEGA
jgi:Sec-independent protein translocase protein TatA